ncbi:pyruvate, phosphate dikinase [Rickettsiales endosymbiont of Stachyamoeba lipophora]|uniref:pyruvate, phosphate dikinase n=1 Tax=Rickettsiales endosymbiont of Stachyamoeba lipophora TaxID=2486578 RepID=UPI000F64E09A|nr:pyruvate, phosphate dikinase [Rickettsiales endosymbiont of Stachyamoeba lipophora]AZL15398.1 pyruvate, phosphate dikinase [Rickettsiales endosymbiont of Stachyamoeba lipophora]
MNNYIYTFGNQKADGNGHLEHILGGKGANLAEMSLLGLPVPPGFTITTEICQYYYKNHYSFPVNFDTQVYEGIHFIEGIIGAKFDDTAKPLLISIRSGAAVSMPGMMDSILNLGLNDQTIEAFAKNTESPRFAYDCYRRFIQMYSDVVLNIHLNQFEELFEIHKEANKVKYDHELSVESLKELIVDYKKLVRESTGQEFPQNAHEQLFQAIQAVLKSWMSERAIAYREINNIPNDLGTAVNIQAMVFGNMGKTSATGVCFTRDPSNGEKYLFGEYLLNAQGEDVVAGIRTPKSITLYGQNHNTLIPQLTMEEEMPEAYHDLCEMGNRLEQHFGEMQDIEFTVQQGKLWLLQTRNGKRSAKAAINMAISMAQEGYITKEEALLRIEPKSLDQLLHPSLDPDAKTIVIDYGLPASPGAVSGRVTFSVLEAEKEAKRGHKVILVRNETSPEDINGMIAAHAILTARGGMTSHAAVVARGMGKPCVCGASNLKVDYLNKIFFKGEVVVKEGDIITINGSTGEIYLGEVPTIEPNLSPEFQTLLDWAKEIKTLKVYTNAETAQDLNMALKFGAEGIGLCRTEHMFFDPDRLPLIREMIMASNAAQRKEALASLLPMQLQDFKEIFKLMGNKTTVIRLLDPPLHEFLPNNEKDFQQIAEHTSLSLNALKAKVEELHESNPMLGHRGCRLAISYPEIYEMQVTAIISAAIEIKMEYNIDIMPEILVPLVMNGKEMAIMKTLIDRCAEGAFKRYNQKTKYQVGAMIELPGAALRANDIMKHAEFFSFGSNDLTQTTLGLSRDDSCKFLNDYLEAKIFEVDPFIKLDEESVGELIKIAVERGRANNHEIKIGICGEHGGHADTIQFSQSIGLNYVSCSPFRVPGAILAAAHAAIKSTKAL